MIYQIGVAPIRVDIMMGLAGIEFEKSWQNRKRAKYEKVTINIIGKKKKLTSVK